MTNQLSTKHSKNPNSSNYKLKRNKEKVAHKARQQMSPLMQLFQQNVQKLYWEEKHKLSLS